MDIPSIANIKKELNHLPEKELIRVLLEMAKFTTDNKQFLFFQVFGKDHPGFFQEMVEEELQKAFELSNRNNYYVAKKSAQAIRKKLNKYLKFTKDKTIKIELITFYCKQLHTHGFLGFRHPVIDNLYQMQIKKIRKLVEGLHEDLQYDYEGTIEELEQHLEEN